MKFIKATAAIAFALTSFSTFAADYPAPKEADFIARDFKFHTGEVMAELRLQAPQLLMVGDTSHDLGMAKSAGVDAVAVTYGAHPVETLRTLAPRACVASVGELRQWLTTNG